MKAIIIFQLRLISLKRFISLGKYAKLLRVDRDKYETKVNTASRGTYLSCANAHLTFVNRLTTKAVKAHYFMHSEKTIKKN